ncbi:hypothetical protein F5B20DRAFT_580581 [Whalleya microplaca]|nr:hypothetical protein F5B20DRAFT_580581 [Whalleya microplaca]
MLAWWTVGTAWWISTWSLLQPPGRAGPIDARRSEGRVSRYLRGVVVLEDHMEARGTVDRKRFLTDMGARRSIRTQAPSPPYTRRLIVGSAGDEVTASSISYVRKPRDM